MEGILAFAVSSDDPEQTQPAEFGLERTDNLREDNDYEFIDFISDPDETDFADSLKSDDLPKSSDLLKSNDFTPNDAHEIIEDQTEGGDGLPIPTIGGAEKNSDDAKSLNILGDLVLTTSECSEDPERPAGAPCSCGVVLDAVVKFAGEQGGGQKKAVTDQVPIPDTKSGAVLPTEPSQEATAIRKAAKALKCDSESCVLSHPKFVEFAVNSGVPEQAIQREKRVNFKAAGPRNTTALLNNFQIDETLEKWARTYTDFFNYPFAMMDFDRTNEKFAFLDIVDILEGRAEQSLGPGFGIVRRKSACAGCVVNTDVSTGPGKHWVAVFVDTRETTSDGKPLYTVEYFNSAGSPPPKPMVRWMERTRARLQQHNPKAEVQTVPVTSITHQNSRTECGLYSLFYIRKRLEGSPISFFQNSQKIIADDAMTKFRQFVFRVHA